MLRFKGQRRHKVMQFVCERLGIGALVHQRFELVQTNVYSV
jgi:hypothetical protein